MKKIRIAISACLIGLKYRYDGTSKMDMAIIDALKDKVDFIPVCPEVECGLSIPRPPMHLEVSPRGTRLKITETGEDVTLQMLEWGHGKLDKLERLKISAYIFKARSPSCGLNSSVLHNPHGKCISNAGKGIFATQLTRRFPDLPVCQESDFMNLLDELDLLD